MSPLLAPLVAIAISAGVAVGTIAHVERMYSNAKADIAEIRRVIDDEHAKAARIAYTVNHLKEGSLPQWHAAGYIKEAPFFSIEKEASREEEIAYFEIRNEIGGLKPEDLAILEESSVSEEGLYYEVISGAEDMLR